MIVYHSYKIPNNECTKFILALSCDLVCVVTVIVGVGGVEGEGDAGGQDGHQDEVFEHLLRDAQAMG